MKRYFNVLLCVSLIFCELGIYHYKPQIVLAATDTKITNVTATASSSYYANPPSDAVDEPSTAETWWSTSTTGTSYLQLELDHTYSIDRWYVINLGYFSDYNSDFDAQNTRDYVLQSSLDGSDWTNVDVVNDNTEDVTDRMVTPFTAKYVRINILQPVQDDVNPGCASIVDFEVFATNPTVNSVSVPVNGTYDAGMTIDFNVDYTADVWVDATGDTPYIPLTIGASTREAVYSSGSGSKSLTFEYTVKQGDYDNDGITLGTNIVDTGGSIKDYVSTPVSLGLNNVGNTLGVLVDARELYRINLDSFSGGNITTNKTSATEGEQINLTITPNAGKQLKVGSLKYNDGVSDYPITGTSFTMPESDVTISAVFEDIPPITYPVHYIAGASITIPDNIVNDGDKVTEPTVTTTGYRQDGWYKDSAFTMPWDFNTDTVTGEITLYLKLTPIGNVSFETNGAMAVSAQTVGSGEKVQEPGTLTKEGYLFDGWYLTSDFSGERYDFTSTVTLVQANEMRTLYAKWNRSTYQIIVDTIVGGSITADKTHATQGETISLTLTPDTGKQLKIGSLKYNDGISEYPITGTSFTMPESDVTISAVFEDIPPITYPVHYVVDASITIPDNIVNDGDKVTEPTVTTTGYRQDGWYKDNTFTTPWDFNTDTVTGEITLYLKLTPTGNVSFETNGAMAVSAQTVGSGEKVQEPGTLTKEGYLFDGWYLTSDFSGERYDFTSTVTLAQANEMRTLYAKWNRSTYQITVDTIIGGSITADKTHATQGETISLTLTPDTGKQLKIGSLKYNDGVSDYPITGTSFTMPASNVTISGEFEDIPPITYPVHYVVDASITIPDNIVNDGDKVTEPTVTTTGYRKDGWYKDSTFTTPWDFNTDTVTEEITLYLKLTPKGNVSFETNGAMAVSAQTVGSGEKIQEPGTLTKEGYLFDGWYLTSDFSGERYDFTSTVTLAEANEMRTLYAKWNRSTYQITVDTIIGGSITVDKIHATQGETVNLTITPDAGKQLKIGSLKYNDGVSEYPITGTSFTMPASDITISAEFIAAPVNSDKTVISVVSPIEITNLPNGTAKNAVDFGLPNTLILNTDHGNITADVNWDVNNSTYDATIKTEQSFIVTGSIVLPNGVVNPNNVALVTSIRVTVSKAADTNTDNILLRIVTPSAITMVENGTEKSESALGLPNTVTLVVTGGSINANINWDLEACSYNPTLTSAQTFLVRGVIILPQGVVNTNNISLILTISVSVKAVNSNSGSNGGGSNNNNNYYSDISIPNIEGGNVKGWESIRDTLKTINDSSLIVNMNKATVVPKEIFEDIKGKDINVTFMLNNGFEWIINGLDIKDTLDEDASDEDTPNEGTFSDIDFGVTFTNGNIPDDLTKNLLESNILGIPLHLAYEGRFGFKANLKFSIGSNSKGKIANLFYYNPDKKELELIAVSEVGKFGEVVLPFTHASDYLFVLSDMALLGNTIDEISVSPVNKTLYIGGTKGKSTTLKIITPEVITNAVNDGVCNITVSYISSNPKIATISKDGNINAKQTGKTNIITTITINGIEKKYVTSITVKKAYIKFKKSTITMKKGKTFVFQAVGYGVDTKDIKYVTTKRDKVVISKSTGKAKAKSSGTDYVIASVGEISLKIKVIVK